MSSVAERTDSPGNHASSLNDNTGLARSEGRGKGPLNGLWPLVLVAALFLVVGRSCFGGLGVPFLGGSSGANSRGNGRADATSGPTTTVDPIDELWQMMDPIEPECPAKDGSSGRHLQWTEAPPMCIDPAKDYTATLHTDRGDIVIALNTDTAPMAVNNFVFLARWRYYDGVRFHAVVPQWMIQTGDPMGRPPGHGNPGYTIPDELPPEGSADPLYSVVMAGYADKPDSSGAQFSIVTGWESHHQSRFTRFGRVIKGRDVVNAIDDTGARAAGIANSGHDGAPREPTTINTVTITGH